MEILSGTVLIGFGANPTPAAKVEAKKKAEQNLQEKIKNNSDKIEKIESDLTEIKQMLVHLINKDK